VSISGEAQIAGAVLGDHLEIVLDGAPEVEAA
jgi:hypothetical protein